MESFENNVKKFYALVDIDRKIVGVKLLKDKSQFDSYDVINLIKPLSYCVSVKSASLGHRIKYDKLRSGCGGSTRALGFEKPTDDFLDGRAPLRLGLFKDQQVSMESALHTTNVLSNTYGVLVQPIEFFSEEDKPDVAIVIGKPRELMRIMQGYTYNYGINTNMSMSGNQGICVETTAYPLIHNTINMSLLCSGTRYLAQWKDEEAAIGISMNILDKVIDGLYDTVNAVEMDKRKSEISKDLISKNIDCIQMEYGKTYYTEYEEQKRKERDNENH